jgi:hypothetical protein
MVPKTRLEAPIAISPIGTVGDIGRSGQVHGPCTEVHPPAHRQIHPGSVRQGPRQAAVHEVVPAGYFSADGETGFFFMTLAVPERELPDGYNQYRTGRRRMLEVHALSLLEKYPVLKRVVFIQELNDGYCSYPDAIADPCSSTIARAHTIQRNGGLAAIAEGGHVLTVRPTIKDLIASDGNPSPRKIGIRKASVFPGFCSKHDEAIFKPIEGKLLTQNANTAFLFSYRAIAYERFNKERQRSGAEALRRMDQGRSFPEQCRLQERVNEMVAGIQAGRRDVDRWKQQFDKRFISGMRDDFHFLSIKFDHVLPIVACCAFHPQFDLQGNPLQRLGRDGVDYEHVTLTVTVFDGHTIMVLGWIGSQDGPAHALMDSYQKVADDRKADALIRLLFIHTDNLFLQPSWWDGLSAANKVVAMAMAKSGTTMRSRSSGELADDKKSFVIASILEMVGG